MKGKDTFTQHEATQILELIAEKLEAEPTEQKGIRHRIRTLGFYQSDFSLPKREGGYNQEDFLSVVTIQN